MFTKEDGGHILVMSASDHIWDQKNMDLSKEAVEEKLMKLASDKSPGPDGIHPMVLKECASAVSEPLSLIFRKSYDTGTRDRSKLILLVSAIAKTAAETRDTYTAVAET